MTTTSSVSKRPRGCKNGCRHVGRSMVAPNSGWCRKLRAFRTTCRGASALRVPSSKTANDRLALSLSLSISFPAQRFVSRSKHRLASVHHIRIPPVCIFCFVMPGRRGANGEQQYTLFWHDVEIFPPKMTKRGPRPRVCQSAPGGVKTVIG